MVATPVPDAPPFEVGAVVRFVVVHGQHPLAAPNRYAGVDLRVVRVARRVGAPGWCVYAATPEGRLLPPFLPEAFERVLMSSTPAPAYSTVPMPATARMRSGTWFIASSEWKAIKQVIAAARVAVAMGNEVAREQLALRLEDLDAIESARTKSDA